MPHFVQTFPATKRVCENSKIVIALREINNGVWVGYLKDSEKMVANERVEAVFTEAVDVGNEVSAADGEIAGTGEEGLCGVAEGVVAVEDFVHGVLAQRVQNIT